jgi:hypothetical protein
MSKLILKASLSSGAIRGFKLRIILLFFAASLIGPPALQAAKYEFRAGGLSLWLPDDWSVDLEAKAMTGFSTGREAFLKLSLIEDANNLNAAFLKYPEILRSDITGYRETQARRAAAIAGFDGLSARGEGIVERVKSSIQVFVFKTPRAFVVLACLVVAEKANQYRLVLERIKESIGKIRALFQISFFARSVHGLLLVC